ncbi:hypothetical protein CDL15_Pgr022276 [Punica granatum]|uniref:Uncharacterized protein n=1 Tax=Punica granatum TaxID=22663 RepID=A0A218WMI8_PUNGR|nr:hypothetical protein CDL15_Pgr022276 [Punica granatum]
MQLVNRVDEQMKEVEQLLERSAFSKGLVIEVVETGEIELLTQVSAFVEWEEWSDIAHCLQLKLSHEEEGKRIAAKLSRSLSRESDSHPRRGMELLFLREEIGIDLKFNG